MRTSDFRIPQLPTRPPNPSPSPVARPPSIGKSRKAAKAFAAAMTRALLDQAGDTDANSDAKTPPATAVEDKSPTDAGSTSTPANIIPFPLPTVIIPFPVLAPADSAWARASGAESADPWSDVEIDVNWPGWNSPAPQPGSPANVKAVDFREGNIPPGSATPPSTEGTIIPVTFGPDRLPAVSIAEDAAAVAIDPARTGQLHLPGAADGPEENAGLADSVEPGGVRALGIPAARARIGTPSFRAALGPVLGADPAGTSAAQKPDRMGSPIDSEAGNSSSGPHGRAGEGTSGTSVKDSQDEVRLAGLKDSGVLGGQMGRAVESSDRPGLGSESAPGAEAVTVDKLAGLVLRETTVARQHPTDSMSVMLRPDDQTELFVHFKQRNGVIQATIRCERGDFHQLNALWPELQAALAQQRVRLAPLQESTSGYSGSGQPDASGFGWSGQDSGTDRRPSPDRHSLDEWPTPASSEPGSAQERGRRGSGTRLATSRPGWETWA